MKTNVPRIALLANGAAVLLAVFLVWQPEISAYWTPRYTVTDAQLDAARSAPADALLDEIGRQRFGILDKPVERSLESLRVTLHRADHLMKGKVAFTDEEPIDISFPFEAANLTLGPPPFWLDIAGLATVELLLDAYRASSQQRYLDAAAQELRAFARVDRWSLVPRGLFWNDHALANRMSILAASWQLVRHRSDVDPQLAKDILYLASTTAARLSKPNLFTYRTNHGVMQSLALLQYAAAFPALEGADSMKTIGCERLLEQVRHYVSPEGAVLEHSAGYHEFGRDLLEAGVRLSTLTGCRAQRELEDTLGRVRSVSALLRRPDGSLPIYGNTDYAHRIAAVQGMPAQPEAGSTLLPASGLAIWWMGRKVSPEQASLSQTVITWSAYPSGAHKHADEMSMAIWAGGQSWIGGTGYWPYSTRSYDAAQGWRSSNAPHFVNEPARSERTTRLRGVAETRRIRAIDLERHLGDGSRIRRRIVEIDGSAWLVVDTVASESSAPVERLWTLPPDADLQSIESHSFLLKTAPHTKARLSFVGELAGSPTVLRGSHEPFGGWVINKGSPVAAPAVVVTQPPRQSVLASVFETSTDDGLAARPLPVFARDADGDGWQISLQSSDGPLQAAWRGQELTLRLADGSNARVQVTADTGAADAMRLSTIAAYEAAAERYPRFREITAYRYKVTIVALLLILAQECVVFLARRALPRAVPSLRLLAASSWVAFALYAALWYLR